MVFNETSMQWTLFKNKKISFKMVTTNNNLFHQKAKRERERRGGWGEMELHYKGLAQNKDQNTPTLKDQKVNLY